MIQLIDRGLIERVTADARTSTRRRMNHNFHESAADNPHRFLNVILRGSYVRPHRHLRHPKSEGFLAIEGEGLVLRFDDAGAVTEQYRIGRGAECDGVGVDIAPGVWHTVAALSEVLVCYEVKPGPWDPATDKEFAAWAPEEGSPDAAAWLSAILKS